MFAAFHNQSPVITMLKFRLGNLYLRCISRDTCLRELNVIDRTVFVIKYKIKGFREKVVCVIVSTFLTFMFADLLLFVDVLSYLYYHVKKQQWQTSVINH